MCIISPVASVVDTAQYYLALSYFSDKEYELAQVEFNRLAVNYPASVYFENAIFMKAVCYYEGTPKHYGLDQSALTTAIRQFEDFIIDFPESDVVPDCQTYLLNARTRLAHKFYNSAETYRKMRTYKAAEVYYQKVVDEYTSTEYAPLATYGLAKVKYKMKDYQLAKEKFQDFTLVFQDHELAPKAAEFAEKSAFQSGEQAYEKNELEKAKELFESFKNDYPSSKKLKDVDKYLDKISKNIQIEQNDDEENS